MCDTQKIETKDLKRVLQYWRQTNSPFWGYWAKLFNNYGLKKHNYILPSERCGKGIADYGILYAKEQRNFRTEFFFGLPEDEVKAVCRSIYANEMVKLTLQIADPTVMVIEKDVSATFTDQLGVVGKKYV